MRRLYLWIILICCFVSCDNFDPKTDSYMWPCEMVIDMSVMYDDFQNDCFEICDSDYIRVSAFFYAKSSGKLLYNEEVFLKTLPQEFKMSVHKLDVSQDKDVIIFVDKVHINEFGDAFGNMYISKIFEIDSIRVAKGTGLLDTDRAYYAAAELPAMQQVAECALKDCCRKVTLKIENAFYLNSMEFYVEYDNFFYFSDTPSERILSVENINYIQSSSMEIVFTFLSKSKAKIYINDVLSIDLLEYPTDTVINCDCHTWEYDIVR